MEPTHPPRTRSISELLSRKSVRVALFVVLILLCVVGGFVWYQSSTHIFSDKAEVSAPLIALSTPRPGVLKELLVHEGDSIESNVPVARMDDEYIRSDTRGLIVAVDNQIGHLFSPGTPVVTMINPRDLRIVARIDEDKGIRDVHPGQRVVFTVDAFGSRTFDGVVEEIVPTSHESSVVFSISDKREQKQFTVNIAYSPEKNPQFLNGMSARVWIQK